MEYMMNTIYLFGLACSLLTLTLADLIVRWRAREMGLREISEWKCLVPLPYLALIGGISALVGNWLSWGLLAFAALAASDSIKVHATSSMVWEKAILLRGVLVFEIAVVATLAKYVLSTVVAYL